MDRNLRILLIEDDQDDVDLFRFALQNHSVQYEMNVLMQGHLVDPYLQSATSLPDVIVMDLNLPMVHGREVLKLIRSTSSFRDVPVVVLTTSSTPEDRLYCLTAGADEFITKPTTMAAFNAAITTVTQLAHSNR